MPVTPQLDAIFVGLGATPLPPGPPYIPIDPMQAESAFDDAIDSLPDDGGVLYVMPGSSTYQFTGTVAVDKPNVVLDFVGGSTLVFGNATMTSLFHVTEPGFRCRGARVVHTITAASNPDDRTCLLIEADEAEVSQCSFAIRQGDGSFDIQYFSCVRVLQSIPANGYRNGVRLTRNSFVLDTAGVDQSDAWVPVAPPGIPYPLPRGVCCIGAERARGLIITGNSFRSSASGTKAACGPAIYLVTSEQCSVSSNTIRDLRTSAGGQGADRGAIIRMSKGPGAAEGHHTVLSANAFTDIESAILVGLDDVRYDYIAANVFDRIGSATRPCYSVVRVNKGEVLGIVGNAFSRIEGPGADEAGIFLDGLRQCTISGNVFSEVGTGQGYFGAPAGQSSIVQFDAQQARAEAD